MKRNAIIALLRVAGVFVVCLSFPVGLIAVYLEEIVDKLHSHIKELESSDPLKFY